MVCNSRQSHSAVTASGELFRKMFPDSKIAAKFSVAETKCTYITKFGLAPYFTRMLVSRVKPSGPFVVMFDESLNRSTQTKQMTHTYSILGLWPCGNAVLGLRVHGSCFS